MMDDHSETVHGFLSNRVLENAWSIVRGSGLWLYAPEIQEVNQHCEIHL